MDQAVELLEQTRKMRLGVDLVLLGSLLSTCERMNQWRRALHVLETGRSEGFDMSLVCYHRVVAACSNASRWSVGLEVLKSLPLCADLLTFHAVVEAYHCTSGWRGVTEALQLAIASRLRLVVANVGDSRAVLGKKDGSAVRFMAIRKVNGQVSRKEKALKVQLEAVKEKEKANKEAEAKAAKTLEAIKSHTEEPRGHRSQTNQTLPFVLQEPNTSVSVWLDQHGASAWTAEDFTNRAQKSREALAALEDAVSAHVGKGEDLQRAKSAWKMLADKVDNMTANLTAQRNESTVKIDAIKQETSEFDAQLAQLGDIKKTKAQEHEKLEAEMHAARDAMQKHQLLLDDAIAAVDAAAAQADQATKQAKVLDNEHEEQKQGLMMLKAVRGSIDSFYHKLQALSESMEETHGETSKSAPERMKEDPNLKPSLESYNAMVQSFHDLHAFSSKLYGTIQPAVTQIKHNAFSEILVECDPGENLEREADESKDFTKLQDGAPEKAARLLVEAAHTRDPMDDKTALVIWFGEKPDNPTSTALNAPEEEDLFVAGEAAGRETVEVEAPVAAVQEDDMFAESWPEDALARTYMMERIPWRWRCWTTFSVPMPETWVWTWTAPPKTKSGKQRRHTDDTTPMCSGVPVEDDGSLTHEELQELNKRADQRPARPRLPTAFTQTGVAEAVQCLSPRMEDMVKSMPEHMKEG
eukprot:g27750.t1